LKYFGSFWTKSLRLTIRFAEVGKWEVQTVIDKSLVERRTRVAGFLRRIFYEIKKYLEEKMKKTRLKAKLFDAVSFSFLVNCFLFLIFSSELTDQNRMASSFFIFFILFLIGIFLSWFISRFQIETWGHTVFNMSSIDGRSDRPWFRRFWCWQAIAVLTVALIVGTKVSQISLMEIASKSGFEGAKRLFSSLLSPDWSVLPTAVAHIFETVFMAFMSTSLAVPFAFVLSFLSARNVMTSNKQYALYLVLRTFFNLVRSIEAVVWAIIFSVWVGIGPFAGMLALMVHSVVSLAKQYSEAVESVSSGPLDGIRSTGANSFQVVLYGIVPQVLLPYISFTLYRWDINIRMATIVGIVGGGGIGAMLYQYQGQGMWSQVGCIIVVIAIAVWLLDQASAHIREVLK
jgi:phosphonate transport system permease protein